MFITTISFLGIYPEPFLTWRDVTKIKATDLITFDSTTLVLGIAGFPHLLDFDLVDNKVYFMDNPHICRANLDFESQKEIVAEKVFARDIVIDWIGRRIFWTTINQNDIKTMDLSGSEKRIFISTQTPDLIALDPIAG